MFRMSVLYMNRPDATFDMDYYVKKHMPMVNRHLGKAVVRYEVTSGLPGPSGTPTAMVAAGHFYLSELDSVGKAMATHGPEILGDIKNYTNIQPVLVHEQLTYP